MGTVDVRQREEAKDLQTHFLKRQQLTNPVWEGGKNLRTRCCEEAKTYKPNVVRRQRLTNSKLSMRWTTKSVECERARSDRECSQTQRMCETAMFMWERRPPP